MFRFFLRNDWCWDHQSKKTFEHSFRQKRKTKNKTMVIHIKFAGSNMSPSFPSGTTLSCIKSNADYPLMMGYSREAVQFVVNGANVPDSTVLSDGDIVSIQHKAHEKAA